MFSGSKDNQIIQYNDIDDNLSGSFTLVGAGLGNVLAGNRTHPAFADLTNNYNQVLNTFLISPLVQTFFTLVIKFDKISKMYFQCHYTYFRKNTNFKNLFWYVQKIVCLGIHKSRNDFIKLLTHHFVCYNDRWLHWIHWSLLFGCHDLIMIKYSCHLYCILWLVFIFASFLVYTLP